MSRRQDRFLLLMKAIDRLAVRAAAITLACLFVAQALLLNPTIRHAVNLVEQLEGRPIEVARRISPEPSPALPAARGRFTIVSESGPARSAVLLVNGEEIADFGNGRVSADVRAGDLVEIDGGMKPVRLVFRVTEVSPGMIAPAIGQTVETVGTIEILARVKIR